MNAARLSAFGVHARDSTNRIAHSMTDPLVRRFVSLARKWLPEVGPGDLLARQNQPANPISSRHPSVRSQPNAYLIDLRIAKACSLLRDSDLPLAEIAKKSGFANANRLITAFTARFPVTPGVWRRG